MENERTGVMSGPHKLVIDTSSLGYEYEYEYEHSYVCEGGGGGGDHARWLHTTGILTALKGGRCQAVTSPQFNDATGRKHKKETT